MTTEYYTFEKAFEDAQQCTASDNATMKVLKDKTYYNGCNASLTSGKFTLDLNGLSMSNYIAQPVFFINGADLTLTDNSDEQTGKVSSAGKGIIGRSGALTIDNGTFESSDTTLVFNSGNAFAITLNGGTYSNGLMMDAENTTLTLNSVAMFDDEENEISLSVDEAGYKFTDESFSVNPYYTVGETKGKLTKNGEEYVAENLTLVDGKDFKSDYDFTAKSASYSRTMANEWGTICLPFAVSIDESQYDLYNVVGYNDEAVMLTKQTEPLEAGVPAVIRRADGATDISVTGTDVKVVSTASDIAPRNGMTVIGVFQGKEITKGLYVANNKMWNAELLDEPAIVNAYYAYIVADRGDMAKSMSFVVMDEEDPTAIGNIDADEQYAADGWYTLDGRKLEGKPAKKGIYLHNGKKIAIK